MNANHNANLILSLTLLLTAGLASCSTAPSTKAQPTEIRKAQVSTHEFERSVRGLTAQLNNAAGFVIFPDVMQWGILISGGSFGRGVVARRDGRQIGWAAINVGSIGLQAGVQGFRMLMVLQDQKTLDTLMANQLSGSVNGVLVLANGNSASMPFENGVAVYEAANKGLMAGMSIGLKYIRYVPLQANEASGSQSR